MKIDWEMWVTGIVVVWNDRHSREGGRRRIIDRRWTHAPHTTISLYLNRYYDGPSQKLQLLLPDKTLPFSQQEKEEEKKTKVRVCMLTDECNENNSIQSEGGND